MLPAFFLASALLCGPLLSSSPARADPGPAPDLTGTWGLEIAAVSAAKVPIIGELKSTTRTQILLHLSPMSPVATLPAAAETTDAGDTQLGGTDAGDPDAGDPDAGDPEAPPSGPVIFQQEHRVCAAEAKGGLVKTRVPKGYVDAIAPKLYQAVLAPAGSGWSYDADTLLYTIGYDRSCGQVPTDPDDACVEDPDHDGHPGVTVHAKAPAFPWVRVYVAQQAHPILRGHVVDSSEVEGGLELQVQDTVVLGASNSLFNSSPSVRPLAEESRFRMVRLGADAGCTEVLATFGGNAPVE